MYIKLPICLLSICIHDHNVYMNFLCESHTIAEIYSRHPHAWPHGIGAEITHTLMSVTRQFHTYTRVVLLLCMK